LPDTQAWVAADTGDAVMANTSAEHQDRPSVSQGQGLAPVDPGAVVEGWTESL